MSRESRTPAITAARERDVYKRQGFGFLDEAALAFGVGNLSRREDFERDYSLEARVCRFVDDSHAAFAQLFADLVMRD